MLVRYHWGMGIGHVYSWKNSDLPEAETHQTVEPLISGFVGVPDEEEEEEEEEEVSTTTPISEEDEGEEFDLGDRENEHLSGEDSDDNETFNSDEESDDEAFMEIHDMYDS